MSTATQLLSDPEGITLQSQNSEPVPEPVLADAEEEEFVVLWASDPGNQGA